MPFSPPRALTIGTSDSSGVNGIQADLRTFAAIGVDGTSVVSAVAARNTRGLAAVAEVPEEVVIAQIDTVLEDIGASAVKTGALWSPSIAGNVVDRLEAWGVGHLVVEPGTALLIEAGRLGDDLIRLLHSELFPLATLVMLDVVEAELFSGIQIRTLLEAQEALRRARGDHSCWLYLANVAAPDGPIDLVFDGAEFTEVPRTQKEPYSLPDLTGAAATAYLALGHAPLAAVQQARDFQTAMLHNVGAADSRQTPSPPPSR